MFIFKMASKMAAESVKSLYLNYYSTKKGGFGVLP